MLLDMKHCEQLSLVHRHTMHGVDVLHRKLRSFLGKNFLSDSAIFWI